MSQQMITPREAAAAPSRHDREPPFSAQPAADAAIDFRLMPLRRDYRLPSQTMSCREEAALITVISHCLAASFR